MGILDDAQHVPPSTPVYSHPLLRTAKTTGREAAAAASGVDALLAADADNGHVGGGAEDAPEFLDPLGAFASTSEAPSSVGRRNGDAANGTTAVEVVQPATFADPLVAGRLGNTLRYARLRAPRTELPSRARLICPSH